jgi:glycosyltransferase involved in cell wall biosynthesis
VKHHLPDPFVLYVGSISPRKNVARLLRAFAEWKKRCGSGHKLVLVGTGKQWKSQEDFRLIKQPGIAEHVVLVEYVSDEDLVGIYNLADLLIYPSLYEGFGLPILEAMACGCPVITSKVSSMPEVAGDAAILIDPEDEVGLCGAIDRVLVQPRLRQDLIAKGFERVQQFSWQRAATQTLQIIRQVAGQ